MLVEEPGHTFHGIGMHVDVRVHEHQDVARGGRRAKVPRGAGTAGTFADAHHPGAEPGGNLSGPVGRRIVDHDDLVGRYRRIAQRRQAMPEILAAVENGHDDADAAHREIPGFTARAATNDPVQYCQRLPSIR